MHVLCARTSLLLALLWIIVDFFEAIFAIFVLCFWHCTIWRNNRHDISNQMSNSTELKCLSDGKSSRKCKKKELKTRTSPSLTLNRISEIIYDGFTALKREEKWIKPRKCKSNRTSRRNTIDWLHTRNIIINNGIRTNINEKSMV